MSVRVRFAPSPTGHLHVGNVRTALFNWLLARRHAGTFVLRIEDTDIERSTAAYEQGVLDDLRWLGLEWDEGPDVGGAAAPYRQSERTRLYQDHARRLLDAELAYRCFCSPERLAAARERALRESRPPGYDGTCRRVPAAEAMRRAAEGEAFSVRFRIQDVGDVGFDDLIRGHVSVSSTIMGDPVLLRSDGRPAYNFAVVVDDAAMTITHVVRGEDHISNTPRQVLICRALGFEPPRFAHVSLVMGPDHAPLSKRHGATSVREFRDQGILPEALANYLALLGWSPGGRDEILPLAEMARRFSLEGLSHSPAVFDPGKLAWINRHYLREADRIRLLELSLGRLEQAGFVTGPPEGEGREFLADLVALAAESVDRLDEIPGRVGFVFRFDARTTLAGPDGGELRDRSTRPLLDALARALGKGAAPVDREYFRAMVEEVKSATGRKGKALFHPIRVALTGEGSGPELDRAVPAIERGARLPPSCGVAPVTGCRERTLAILAALDRTESAGA